MPVLKLAFLALACLPLSVALRRGVWVLSLNNQKHEGILSTVTGYLSVTDEAAGIRMQTPLSRLKELTVSAGGDDNYNHCKGQYSAYALTDDGKILTGCIQDQGLRLTSGSTVFDLSKPADYVTLKLKP